MDNIFVRNIFAAVFDKKVLDPILEILKAGQKARPFSGRKSGTRSGLGLDNVRFWGTEGTVEYLKQKGFKANSVVSGFDFDGRVKTLDRKVFAAILADRSKRKHLSELKKLARYTSEVDKLGVSGLTPGVESGSHLEDTPGVGDWQPFDLVIVNLYPLDKKNFPESMDIGGQALIRAAIKNYKNVALAVDASSLASLVRELISNKGSTTLSFRKKQAQKAAEFIASRGKLEDSLFI